MAVLSKPTISCGITEVPVLVQTFYKGGLIPISGVNVTLSLKSYIPGLSDTVLYMPSTDSKGTSQTCITFGRGVLAKVQKNDIDFGNGMGVSYIIGSHAGGAGSFTFSKDARTSAPIPIPPKLPICNPPQYLDPLTGKCKTLFPTCTPPQVLDIITGKCVNPIPVCKPPQIYDPIKGICVTPEKPTIPTICPPPQVYDPVKGICVTPEKPPIPPILQPPSVCKIGDVRKIRCPGGTEIVTESCQIDPTTGFNRWVPTGNTCPPPELGKQIKILTYPEGSTLEAYEGQEVTITASIACGLSLSNGETAILYVDGKKISSATTSNGSVSFKWVATTDPSRNHKICVYVPKSDQCSKYGEARDCKTITVSRIIPNIEDRLIKERAQYQANIDKLIAERDRIRQLTDIQIPSIPDSSYQAPSIPAPSIPSAPVTIPVTQPKTGIISIPSVKVPGGVEFPVEIYIDGQLVGAPPVYREVDQGTHTARIQLKGFTPISLKFNVPGGGIKTIEESFI